MISFRTELSVTPQPHKLSLGTKVITAGSCFAEVMGNKLAYYKVQTLVNPFGTIFNPISLFTLLKACLHPEQKFTGELVERDGYWFAYDLHSSFSAPSQGELLTKIQTTLNNTNQFLKSTDLLILTLGTAVGYVHKETGKLVANCHKIPQRLFDKKLISNSEIVAAFAELQPRLQEFNPDLKILLTISPVRHIKETLELNSVSKSVLRVAAHELSQQYSTISYFPAYEIMLDDLRDYRFYKPDMIHPNEVAEGYIWNKFKEAYFDADFQLFTKEWDKISQALNHKPFNPSAPAHQQFLKNTLTKLEEFSQLINCQSEIEQVKSQLS